jgi:cytochrome b involved in lipid metabolism|tara:strand:- start:482 stop:1099 length:618 start_codon:yes stop_codon:yes gene_type:complete
MSSYSGRFISNQKTSPNVDINNQTHKFTLKQISNHNLSNSCLIGVNGNVYNVTKYKNKINEINGINPKLNIKCGKNYNNVNEKNLFTDSNIDYRDYKVGKIKYYNLMIILNILLKITIVIAFIAVYKYTNNIFVLLPLTIYLLFQMYHIYNNFWERQQRVNNRLHEIDPDLVKTKIKNKYSEKIYSELNKDVNNMLYGIDTVDDL